MTSSPKRNVETVSAAFGSQVEEPADLDFARALLGGLLKPEKSIPCRFLYDARGSELFERITKLPEYYPTRTETAILKANVAQLREATARGSVLVEFGSGSSTKTEILLDALDELAGYVAIDISPAALEDAVGRLAQRFPDLPLHPIVGNFSGPLRLPDAFKDAPKLGFFPGSTIGNLTADQAVGLLANMRTILGSGSRLVIGADLRKDPTILLNAYDDAQGITAAFNLNLLQRANRVLKANFDIGKFRHVATYDREHGRIDMMLESLEDQSATVLGQKIAFKEGERIHTEHSHKYEIEGFHTLARKAGWEPVRTFTDDENLFSVHELANPDV